MQETTNPMLCRLRRYQQTDRDACWKLYDEGFVDHDLNPNDTGMDLDNIIVEYLNKPGSDFWVAENEKSEIVGMIGVRQFEDGVGEISRLHVRKDCRSRGIGRQLLETALQFCRAKQYLKVTLDTDAMHEAAIRLFRKFQFRHSHTRTLGDQRINIFYLDLYMTDEEDKEKKKQG